MTVAELLVKLRDFNPDYPVAAYDRDEFQEAEQVYLEGRFVVIA